MRKLNKRQRLAIERKQKAKEEMLNVAKKGIVFPDYNPPPKRKEELTKTERNVKSILRYKEYLRKRPEKKQFTVWEYKDRYSYKKPNNE